MAITVHDPLFSGLPQKAASTAKAEIRKAEVAAGKRAIGRIITRTRKIADLTQDEFAAAVGKDARTVRLWETGEERPAFDAIWAKEALRGPLQLAFNQEDSIDAEVMLRVKLRRRA